MPLYLFKHPKADSFVEIFFGMEDTKEYIDSDGVKWIRQYTSPQLKTEASIDPWSNNDFINKTQDSHGSIGDLMDRSKELSERRAQENGGIDPVKEKYYKDYSKSRNGALHPDKAKKGINNKDIQIDL